jgi:multiphosphoryl transfer protein
MVGLVLVSHSRKLASGIQEIIFDTAGRDFPVAVAAGAGENHQALGTDAVHISEVFLGFSRGDGAVALMDLGSAVLSSEMALELLDPVHRERIRLCAAPLVEGAIAAAVQARAGGDLEAVCHEALAALTAKQQQLQAGTPATEVGHPPLASSSSLVHEVVLTVKNDHGLHARPAASLVQAASRFSCEIEISNENNEQNAVTARSFSSIALLRARKGHRIRVRARGVDADAALREISKLFAAQFNEPDSLDLRSSGHNLETVSAPAASQDLKGASLPPALLRGTPASEGIGVGRLLMIEDLMPSYRQEPLGSPSSELSRLREAARRVQTRLLDWGSHSPGGVVGEAEKIFAAQAAVLNDPVVLDEVRLLLARGATSAAQAWKEITQKLVGSFQKLDDPYLSERASDIRDIARLVLQELSGQQPLDSIRPDPPAILVATDLVPSEAAAYDPKSVLGVITREGSPTTHSAILLRTLGIPMVAGIRNLDPVRAAHKIVAMDGGTGEIWLDPSEALLITLQARQQQWQAQRQAAASLAARPAVTEDGERLEVLANVSSAADAALAVRNGAEGVGVLRSEFLFFSTTTVPSEAEQERAFRRVFASLPPAHTTVVRSLDAGADKPLPFLPQPEEPNPGLGVRGIRLLLREREFFVSHLRAILLAGFERNIAVMFPMIAGVQDMQAARLLLEDAHAQLRAEQKPHLWPVKIGAMIEVPSAALLAEQLAEEAEFFSIGTNDLTQYVLAADRENTSLSQLQDALHPAILRLIKTVVEGARARERHVAVCGDAASDPVAAAVFFGLGIRSLSVRANQVPKIKECARQWRGAALAELASGALKATSAVEVRLLAERLCVSAPGVSTFPRKGAGG